MTHPILDGPILLSPLNKFDPNDRDKGAPPWASYCPDRSPSFKTHANRGTAINSMHNHKWGGGVLYKYEESKWVEVARFEVGDFRKKTCDACSSSLIEAYDEERWDQAQHRYVKTGRILHRNNGIQTFEKRRGKIVTPEQVLMLCSGCYKGLGY